MNRKQPQPLPEDYKTGRKRPMPPSPPPPPPLPPKNKEEKNDFISGFEFNCKRCGKCCGLTPFTRADYKRILSKAKKLHISFVKQSIEGNTVYFVKRIVEKVKQAGSIEKVDGKDLVCPFLKFENDKAFCAIYEDRPELCRKFGDEGWRGMSLCCPYQNISEILKSSKKE